MNGADLMLKVLQRHGVADVFGYPGGAIMPVYDALYKSDIKHYLCRHEQGAAFAALGYSRASEKLGVCLATSGPGVTNLLTGLADAFADSIPVLAITGQVATGLMGTDAFQEVDVLGLSLSITKHSFQVTSIDDLEAVLEEAIYIAQTGRPGPVIVDVPKDIQLAAAQSKPNLIKSEPERLASNESITQAQSLLQAATQPILYVGGGVNLGNAVETLRKFHTNSGIPAVCTLKGLGCIEPAEKHYLGMLGMHGTKAANIAVQQCDLLISVGARFDDRVTGKLNEFAPNAKVIHLDIDPAELNKLRQTNTSLLGNLNYSLHRLNTELSISDWQETCQNMLHEEQAQLANQADEYQSAKPTDIDVTDFLNRLSHKLPKNSVVTTDVGQHQMWAAQHMRFSHPKNFLTSGGLGTMGYGLPAAIGAQLSRPDDSIVAISGDGSIMMNIQELATVNRFNLPIKLIVIDNSRLGMVRQWQELFFEERFSETDLSDNPDFVALAKVFHIDGMRVEQRGQIEEAIERLVSHQGAFLLHLCINESENVWPLVPPNTANHNMLEKRP